MFFDQDGNPIPDDDVEFIYAIELVLRTFPGSEFVGIQIMLPESVMN